ncbi:MAG: hypothetical protein KC417_18050, partial [Myxococcales bacterium]|nr:hypothetical protein [Myxococcales bacterium]
EGAIQNGMIGGSIPNRTLATNLAGAVSLEPWFLEFLLLQSGDLGAACDSISAGLVFEAAGAVRLRAFMK